MPRFLISLLTLVFLFSTTATAERVLFVGDSLSTRTEFAKHMVQFLGHPIRYCEPTGTEEKFNGVFAYARPSSASRHWAARSGRDKNWLCKQKKIYRNGTGDDISGSQLCLQSQGLSGFEVLQRNHRPGVFVIALGGNSLAFSESHVKSEVNQVLDQIPNGSTCFWITPPLTSRRYLQKVKNIEKWTGEALTDYQRVQCHHLPTIESLTGQTECDRFNIKDGLHHTRCGSTLWAKTVISKMCSVL